MATRNNNREKNNMASNIEITIRFTESNLIEEGATFNSFEAFQKALNKVATDAPKGGAYDKVGYRMILSDINFDLSDRIDVHHTSYGNSPLIEQLSYQLQRAAELVNTKSTKAIFRAAAAYIESYAE
jgi:hypothetical protein